MDALVPAQAQKSTASRLQRAAAVARAWHLLSLDAPTVAATWCFAFLSTNGSPADRASWRWPVAFLSLATWLCYVGDRVLDARSSLAASGFRARHRFYGALWRERRKELLIAVCLAAVACAFCAVRGLPSSLLAAYVLLTSAALGYFAWVHSGRERFTRALAKEAAVAIVFAFGCVLPAWSFAPTSARGWLLPAGALFGLLCWLNCVAIERWEGRDSISPTAHFSTHWAARHLTAVLVAGAFAASALAAFERALGVVPVLPACLALAFLLLAVLERIRRRLSVEALRILADVALLTPIAYWLAARLVR